MYSHRPVTQRAARHLIEDPARSDALIAEAAHCSTTTIGSIRARLERAGVIEHVPVASRARVPYPQQPSAARDAILVLGTDAPAGEVARLAGVSLQAAWAMLRKLGPVPLADCAASADAIAVQAQALCERCHAPFTFVPRGNRPPRRWCSPDCRRPVRDPYAHHPPPIIELPPFDFAKGLCTHVPASQASWWTSSETALREAARSICEVCPLLAGCADWSLSLPVTDTAIYGAMSSTERLRLKRAAGR